MKKKSKKTVPKKEEIAEDWCFVCKDGGELRVCDYKDCLKSYHPDCVGEDDSFLDSVSKWNCDWHSCYVPDCHRASTFKCYCCPNSVCRRCLKTAKFVHIKVKKGFCDYCLKLARLVEEKKDVDSDGEAVDFKSRETYEGLFREYWEIINETECLTAKDLISANARYKMGQNYNSDSDGSDSGGINDAVSDFDDSDVAEDAHKPGVKRKRSKGQVSSGKGKVEASITKFIGWGSESLLQFLQSIGKDTTKELSQREVTNIITGYTKKNKLLQGKKITCDERLQLFLRRKTVNKHRIYDILERHFAVNQEQSEDKEFGFSSEDMDDNVSAACKRQRKSTADRRSQREETVLDIPRFYFASIVPENIKLAYLKRSLVEVLSASETFESKIIGSFVRIKADPKEGARKKCYQIGQVTGIKRHSIGGNNQEILLQISDMSKDISINVLSDDDFSEEECLDLKNKVKSGLLKKLTVDGLEQKARSLHEDIIKHWIPRELISLQNRIDQANEKGWRRELFEYLERKQKLQNPTELSRLLQQVPKVIADLEELGPANEDAEDDKEGDEGSPKSILIGTSVIRGANLKGNRSSSEKKEHQESESYPEGTTLVSETASQKGKLPKQTCLKACVTEASPQNLVLLDSEDQWHKKARHSSSPFINLCSDDEDDGKSSAAIESPKKLEDLESSVWHGVGPNGERKRDIPLNVLKSWSEGTPYASKFKVWKTNQSEKEAIPLMDAINLAFP